MVIVKIYLGMSLELLRAVWGQFQIVPYSSLYFSRSIAPFQCLINAKYRILIFCTCFFQSGLLFFILASSVCKSLQCLISTLKQEGESGLLFRLTCWVVLWGGRNTANKSHWCVWGVLTVYGQHWVWPSSWHLCFPGLHCSGSMFLWRGTVWGRHRLRCAICLLWVADLRLWPSWQMSTV